MSRGLKSTGKPAKLMDEEYRARIDVKPLVTSCGICGDRFSGTVAEGRKWAADHRNRRHPDRKQTRRRRGSLQRFTTQDDFRDEGLEKAKEVAEMLRRRDGKAA